MTSRSKYDGSRSLLVIAIDVGTTFSGASYTFLKPGEVPKIYDVTGFKGQGNKDSSTKVPSVIVYSPSGVPEACGAEAKKPKYRKARKTEWFKLELRPPSMRIDTPTVYLPPGKDVIDVFGDFLRYMYDCVQTHILRAHIDGQQLWNSLNRTAHFVLSHPNGWGSYQQGKMRDAAIRGGLVPNTPEGRERIEFVTEGEASFHWCIDERLTGSAMQVGTPIVVADLGGGTIDVSSYLVQTPSPLRLKEQMTPDCALAGSITVTDRFVKSVKSRLRGTKYGREDYLLTLREEFDKDTKCLFDDDGDSTVEVVIGGRDDDFEEENGLFTIESGYLQVPREDIVDAFEPSVSATVDAIRKHIAGRRNANVFLVGGFAASPWVLSETRRRLRAAGITCEVKRADTNTAKAVAHGAAAFYLDRNVTERTMRHTYGVVLQPAYDSSNPEHQARKHALYTNPVSGITYVQNGFFALVKKGQVVKVDSVYSEDVRSRATRVPEAATWSQSIMRYNGTRSNITFTDMDPSAFEKIGWFRCEIPASAMTRRTGQHGAYWAVDYDVVITLGTVEIKAHVEWEENGVKKRTPANSMWEDYY